MLVSNRPQFAGFELWQGGRLIRKRVARISQLNACRPMRARFAETRRL
jgi:hypothetical protein